MIKIIDNSTKIFSSLADISQKDLYYVRILSLLTAYGTDYDFVSFYAQSDNNNNITALISRLDGDFTVWRYNSDDDELREFFLSMHFNSILTDSSFDLPCNHSDGVVMKTVKKAEFSIPYCKIDEYPRLMDLFNLNDYDKKDFEYWYVDISHRIRHGTAKAYTLNVGEDAVSSCILSFIYNDDAVLTSVSTVFEFRKMGYASALLSAVIGDVKGCVYLMREKNKNESFYKKLGFENIGIWRIYK